MGRLDFLSIDILVLCQKSAKAEKWQKRQKTQTIRNYTKKRQRIERKYKKVLAQIVEERPRWCEGCFCNGRLTPSHRIPRSRRRDLIAEAENIDLMCPACHEKVELGQYDELANGEAIKAYIRKVDEEYFYLKTLFRCET